MKISRPRKDAPESGNTLTTTVKKGNEVINQNTEQVLTENAQSSGIGIMQMANISVGFSRTVAPAPFESVKVEIGIQLPVPVDNYTSAVSDALAFSEGVVNSRLSVYKPVESGVKYTPGIPAKNIAVADPVVDELDSLDDVLHPAGTVSPPVYQNSKQVVPPKIASDLDDLDSLL